MQPSHMNPTLHLRIKTTIFAGTRTAEKVVPGMSINFKSYHNVLIANDFCTGATQQIAEKDGKSAKLTIVVHVVGTA